MVLQLFRCLGNCLMRRREEPDEARVESAASGPAPDADLPDGLRPLLAIPGIGPKTVRYLADAGYTSVAEVRAASEEDLAAVEGVGPRAAATLKRALAG